MSSCSLPASWRSSSFWPSPPTSATPRSRCSVEVYSSPRRLGLLLGTLDDALGARVEGQRAALDPGPLGEDRGELAAEPGQVDAEPAQRLGRDAVVGLDERRQQVLRIEDGAVEPLGELLGGDDGLLGLLGESVELHGWCLRWTRVRPAGRAGRRGRGTPRRRPSPRRSSSVGRTTRTRTNRSPWPPPLKRGMPWPLRRNLLGRSGCPAGTLSRTRPFSVPTGISPPRSASRSVTGTSRSRSSPRRVNTRCGLSFVTTTRSRPPGPLPVSRIRLPVVDAARDRDLEALARRARRCGWSRGTPPRGSARPSPRSARSRPAGAGRPRAGARTGARDRAGHARGAASISSIDSVEPPPADRRAAAGARETLRLAGRRALVAEHHVEEVGERAGAGPGRAELVADAATRAAPPAPRVPPKPLVTRRTGRPGPNGSRPPRPRGAGAGPGVGLPVARRSGRTWRACPRPRGRRSPR